MPRHYDSRDTGAEQAPALLLFRFTTASALMIFVLYHHRHIESPPSYATRWLDRRALSAPRRYSAARRSA